MLMQRTIVAFFLFISQLFILQIVHAENTQSTISLPNQIVEQSQSSATQLSASEDAIQHFVRAEFAERRNMLNQWPASIEELDKLVAFVEKDQLYHDGAGHTYIMKEADHLYSYPQDQAIAAEQWPSDLNQVTLVNTLRKALSFGQAKI